jgi:hypothetical protein
MSKQKNDALEKAISLCCEILLPIPSPLKRGLDARRDSSFCFVMVASRLAWEVV